MKTNSFRSLQVASILLLISGWKTMAGSPTPSQHSAEYRQANRLMLDFQDALAQERWQDALAMCSDRVRAAAAKTSPETFFRETMPVERLLSENFGCWSCWTNFFGQFIDLNPQTKGSKPEPLIQWFWAIYATNGNWVVDYPPEKLTDYIANKKAAIQARNEKLEQMRRDLEPKLKGVKTHLVPVSEKFVIGSPMLFRLELMNFGSVSLHYNNSGVVFHPLTVRSASYELVPAHEQPLQIMVRSDEIAPGTTVTLAMNLDIAQNHHITEPGIYYIQFDGSNLEIGEPLPYQDAGRFGENEFWGRTFVSSHTRFPSEVLQIEVTK